MALRGGKASAAIAVAVAAVVPVAGSAAASSFFAEPVLPAPGDLAPNTAARVFEVPVARGKVTKRELRHQMSIAAAGEELERVPGPGEDGYPKIEREALHSALEGIWLYGEAGELGIHVTPAEVSRLLTAIKKASFKNEAEYRRFLRESHYTRRDVRERVELQLLAERVQRRVFGRIERESRSPSEERRKVKEFIDEFNEKWRSRTVCAPAFATERCSNGPAPA